MKDLNFKENIIKVALGIVLFQLTMGLCPAQRYCLTETVFIYIAIGQDGKSRKFDK
jgi:hypothetical protein